MIGEKDDLGVVGGNRLVGEVDDGWSRRMMFGMDVIWL